MEQQLKNIYSSVVILSFMGLLFIASATSFKAVSSNMEINSYVVKQAIFIFLGMWVVWGSKYVDKKYLFENSKVILWASISLLILTQVPHIGYEVNGSSRWINIGVRVQPSEILKLAWLLYIAVTVVEYRDTYKKLVGRVALPYLLISLVLLRQPDLGTFVIITIIMVAALFFTLEEFSFKRLSYIFVIGIAGVSTLIYLSPYRMRRVEAFMSPEADPLNTGYQLMQSFKAMASGQYFGVGWGNSLSVRGYLPEAHTDYIFATILEQFGVFFSIALVAAMLSVPIFMLCSALMSRDKVVALVLSLGGVLMTFEIIVNVSSAIGLMPPKGLSLPFISYGGSSIMMHFILIAIVFSTLRDPDGFKR